MNTTVFLYQGAQFNAVMPDNAPRPLVLSARSIQASIALPVSGNYTGSYVVSNAASTATTPAPRNIHGQFLVSGKPTDTTDAFILTSGEGFALTDQNSTYFIAMDFVNGAVSDWMVDAWNTSGQFIDSNYGVGTGNLVSLFEFTNQTYNGVANEATTPGVWHTLADPTKAAAAPPESFRMLQMSLPAPGVGGVPEPAAWSLMLLGVGGLGVRLRQKRRAVAA